MGTRVVILASQVFLSVVLFLLAHAAAGGLQAAGYVAFGLYAASAVLENAAAASKK